MAQPTLKQNSGEKLEGKKKGNGLANRNCKLERERVQEERGEEKEHANNEREEKGTMGRGETEAKQTALSMGKR